jgi:hypothetical protein
MEQIEKALIQNKTMSRLGGHLQNDICGKRQIRNTIKLDKVKKRYKKVFFFFLV